jgi:GTP-binding protein of the ras superfamily involved in termination of M-phase
MDASQLQEADPSGMAITGLIGVSQIQHSSHIQQEQEPNSSPNIGGITLQEAPVTSELPVTSPTHSNGYSNGERDHHRPLSTDYASSTQNYLPPPDDDQSSRFNSAATPYQPPPPQSTSRPGSGLSSGGDKYAYSQAYPDQNPKQQAPQTKNSVVIKVGMVGDAQIGKTSLMVKYVEGSWDEDYIQTLGVNFMEKTISIRNTEITFSIWDLGGQREFVNMLPLVCNDAVAILFMFDLTRKSTLNSIKEWYRQGRGFNKTAIPFLIGTKFDHFIHFPQEDQEEISVQAKRFAKAMKASLIFSSTSHGINVQKIFKIVLSKAFDLKCTIPEIENIGEPLLLYKAV